MLKRKTKPRARPSKICSELTHAHYSQLIIKMAVEGEDLRSDCVKAFRNATKKGQEQLHPEDYKVAVLELLGYKPSKYEVSSVWKNAKGEGLGLEAFVTLMVRRLQQKDRSELVREVFVALDAGQRGFITEQDCLKAFKEVAPQLRQERVSALFQEVDYDRDGRVSYRDFEAMMNSFDTQQNSET